MQTAYSLLPVLCKVTAMVKGRGSERGGPHRDCTVWPGCRDHKKGFRLKLYEHSLPSQELSLPHSTWLYWSEFGSTMGALSCLEGGKMGVFGVGSSKLRREPNLLMKLKKPVISRLCCLQHYGFEVRGPHQ
jgi:hypothetical protein